MAQTTEEGDDNVREAHSSITASIVISRYIQHLWCVIRPAIYVVTEDGWMQGGRLHCNFSILIITTIMLSL